MADKTGIEWTRGDDGSPGATWNPLRGTLGKWHCVRISPGCGVGRGESQKGGCYAEAMNQRFKGPAYKVGADTPRLDAKALELPLRWRKARRIFVCSMTDLFLEAHPFEWIAAVFGVMAAAPQHTFQVLTKRPARALKFFEWVSPREAAVCYDHADEALIRSGQAVYDGGRCRLHDAPCSSWPLPNVWLGVSCEDQQRAEERIPLLLQCPAAVRFVSAEPLLGPIDIDRAMYGPEGADGMNCFGFTDGFGYEALLQWVIVGGESGRKARPMHPDWARSLRDQCVQAGRSFFFKQWGEWCPRGPESLGYPIGSDSLPRVKLTDCGCNASGDFEAHGVPGEFTRHEDCGQNACWMQRLGKKAAGRLLDGEEWSQWPEVRT